MINQALDLINKKEILKINVMDLVSYIILLMNCLHEQETIRNSFIKIAKSLTNQPSVIYNLSLPTQSKDIQRVDICKPVFIVTTITLKITTGFLLRNMTVPYGYFR